MRFGRGSGLSLGLAGRDPGGHGIVTRGKVTMRTMSFSSDAVLGLHGLGELHVRPSGRSGPHAWRFLAYARGQVRVPDDCDLRLLLTGRPFRLAEVAAEAADEEQKQASLASYRRSFCEALSDVDSYIVRSLLVFGSIDSELTEAVGRLSGLEELAFSSAKDPISDRMVPYLEGLVNLRALSASSPAITDDGLSSLGRLRSLKSLDLWGAAITVRGSRHSRELVLRSWT